MILIEGVMLSFLIAANFLTIGFRECHDDRTKYQRG
jgi:hypothetical protein